MRRVITTLITFVVLSVAALYAMFNELDPELRQEGRKLAPPRMAVDIRLDRLTKKPPPELLWMGDSTIDWWAGPSYATKINKELKPETTTSVAWWAAANFFHYYVLVSTFSETALQRPGPAEERRAPKLIVFIANPRMMIDKQDPDSRLDNLAVFIPSNTMLRNTLLPFHDHGLTIPQMLLAQVTRMPELRRRLELAKGARDAFQQADFWKEIATGPTDELVPSIDRLPAQIARFRMQWSRRIGPGNSTLRMIRPTIQAARAWGAKVLVIGTPIPLHSLRTHDWFHEDDYLRRLTILQSMVEEAGGRYLNLHTALSEEYFRDRLDHYNESGAERMVGLIKPVVFEMLGKTGPES